MKIRGERIIFFLFLLLFFLLPLVWTPLNFELFEFNKMVLVYSFTVLIAGFWLMRMVAERRFIFRKSFLFWPLVFFLLSQVLATIFSIDRHTSLFGYYSRFHGGLLSTLSYLCLYFALISNGRRQWVRKLIGAALISAVLVALWGVAEHFGVDKSYWIQDVQARVFATLGQPNWLAAYLDVILFLVLGRMFFREQMAPGDYFLLSLFYLCLLYTKSKSGLIGFAGGIVFLFLLWLRKKSGAREEGKRVLFSFLLLGAISLWVGTPFTPAAKEMLFRPEKKREAPPPGLNITPSGEIRRIVWRGALKLWQKYPLLGTGVETFAYSYYWVRPREHNLTSEWDFLYNKAHNEYLNFAANSGTIGLLAYLSLPWIYFLWWGKSFFFSKKQFSAEEKGVLSGMAAALVTILLTNFFGFSVVVVALWFFLLPGLSFLLTIGDEEEEKEKKKEKVYSLWRWGELIEKKKLTYLSQGLIGLVMILLLFQIARYWQADLFFAQGKSLAAGGEYKPSLSRLEEAIKLNPREANFYSQLSLTLAELAALNDQADRATAAAQMAERAVKVADRALSLSPYNLNLYKERAKMFYYLSKIKLDYLKDSLAALTAAIKLAPTDAKLYYNAGLMFQALGENQKAKEFLEKALELKPNYDQARYWLKKFSAGK